MDERRHGSAIHLAKAVSTVRSVVKWCPDDIPVPLEQ